MSNGVDNGRYCLEDTMHDLPAVTVRPGRAECGESEGGWVSGCQPPPDTDERDLRAYTDHTDMLLRGLAEEVSSLRDLVMLMGLRLDRLDGCNG